MQIFRQELYKSTLITSRPRLLVEQNAEQKEYKSRLIFENIRYLISGLRIITFEPISARIFGSLGQRGWYGRTSSFDSQCYIFSCKS